MHQFYTLFKKLVVATALVLGSSAAVAGPVYSVNLNTAAFSGQVANLDLSFASNNSVAPLSALLSNFNGDFALEVDRFGSVSGDASTAIAIDASAPLSYVTFLTTLGGTYSFTLAFGDEFVGMDPALFAVTLYTETFDGFIGTDGPVAQFSLVANPDLLQNDALVTVSAGLVTATEVPEPGQWLLMLTALALLAAMQRARQVKR